MMVERHYDDEALISILETNRAASDTHLPECLSCSEKLQSFRLIADALRDTATWDARILCEEPVPATIAHLRAFADQMTAEDAQADIILPQLLAGPREEWMPRLMQHPEWRTAGVVRRLIGATVDALMTKPPDGLEMTALSSEIADHLDPTAFPSNTLAHLRGSAWRERAYALYYVGRFVDALSATERAERCIEQCSVDEYDRARMAIVRTLALRAIEHLSTAMETARFSGDVFLRFGDQARLASARIAETHLLASRGEFASAVCVLEKLERATRVTNDTATHARVLSNLGYFYWKLGRTEDALRHHEAAAALFEALEIRTECIRVRWNVASILASAGRYDDALARFTSVQKAFEDSGMTSEATLVSLEIVEIQLTRGEFAEAQEICRAAMRSFEAAGIAYTARALTALAYIQEAAQLRVATPTLAKHVREYIRRLPQDGNLLFAPPPSLDAPQICG